MQDQDFLQDARTRLRTAVTAANLPASIPLQVSPWVAMSLLQKSIRRGQEGLALRAAATLLVVSPERLWRRCGGIAFEDVGLADLETVALVVAALAGKRFRATLGGEWPVASCIVSGLALASKCRAADDLLMSAELHPAFAHTRQTLAGLSLPELLDLVTGVGRIEERAIALWYAVGTMRRPSDHLQYRRGDAQAAFERLNTPSLAAINAVAQEGYRRTGEFLCPLLCLLHTVRQLETVALSDDPLPPERMIGEVPGWCLDLYSREGRAALEVFTRGTSRSARWLRDHVPPYRRVECLGGVVFRVEGGVVRQRVCWPTSTRLREMVDYDSHGLGHDEARELLDMMRDDIPLLNRVRADG